MTQQQSIIRRKLNAAELTDQPLMRMFSLKHEFSTEWHKFLHPSVTGSDQILNITIGRGRMPFFTQHRKIDVMRIDVLARTTESGDYHFILSVKNDFGTVMTSSQIAMPQKAKYGNLQMASLAGSASNINVEKKISIEKPMSLKLKHSTSTDFKSLATNPDEVKDILLVLHYKLGDLN